MRSPRRLRAVERQDRSRSRSSGSAPKAALDEEDVAESIVCGPDPERHRAAIQEYGASTTYRAQSPFANQLLPCARYPALASTNEIGTQLNVGLIERRVLELIE